MDDPKNKWIRILIIFLLSLAAFIGILGLFVALGDWNTNKNSEIPHEPHSTKETTEQLPRFEITGIQQIRPCLIVIRTIYDNIPQGEEVWCSITGKDGFWYKNKTDSEHHKLFSASSLKTYKIWAAFRGDTVSYNRNGDKIEGFGCN